MVQIPFPLVYLYVILHHNTHGIYIYMYTDMDQILMIFPKGFKTKVVSKWWPCDHVLAGLLCPKPGLKQIWLSWSSCWRIVKPFGFDVEPEMVDQLSCDSKMARYQQPRRFHS